MILVSMYISLVQAIGPARRAAEQGQLLCSGRARGDALKGVPEYDPAGAHLLDGEIALEREAVRPEQLNARFHIGAPVACQFCRRRWHRRCPIVDFFFNDPAATE